MRMTLSEKDCVVLYLSWRLGQPLACPACGANVASRDDSRAGWLGSRLFTCGGCRATGAHLVPDGTPNVLGRKLAESHPANV